MSRRRAFVVVVSLGAASSEGCQGYETCNPPPTPVGVVIGAPEDVVASIAGEGVCDGTARCVSRDVEGFAPGCKRYQLDAREPGHCVVVVRLTNGEDQRFETNIVEQNLCGPALVAEGGRLTTFEVKPPTTSSDASTDG
jgi:hypothetical protein